MPATFLRRDLLRLGAGALASSAVGLPVFSQPSESETYVYKKVDGLEVKADVYRPSVSGVRPVVVWIHGGALIMGHREWVSERVRRMVLDSGYVFVSIDYRLAPETKLPLILSDVEDAFRWVRDEGPSRFQADPDKLAVMGSSAGGYLTLTTGYRVTPRPKALVAFWGYGDLIGDWYSTPSPHPVHHEIKMTREEALEEVDGSPVSDARDRDGDGDAFYQHCRQHGIWPQQVSGWDPHSEASKFDPFMPLKNVTKEYPPTLMIHGTEDTDVPHEQSVLMAEQLGKHGVAYELISIPGGEHGLDGGDPQKIDAAYRSAMDFVRRHIGQQ